MLKMYKSLPQHHLQVYIVKRNDKTQKTNPWHYMYQITTASIYYL